MTPFFTKSVYMLCIGLIIISILISPVISQECIDWESEHPEWIFCDDFESSDPMTANGRYFEYDDNGGDFVVMNDLGVNGSRRRENHISAGRGWSRWNETRVRTQPKRIHE